MRRGEVLGLRWPDLDLEHQHLTVRRTLVPVDGGVVVNAPKTSHSRQLVPLEPRTVAVLRAHRKRQPEERLLIGPGYEDNDHVSLGTQASAVHLVGDSIFSSETSLSIL